MIQFINNVTDGTQSLASNRYHVSLAGDTSTVEERQRQGRDCISGPVTEDQLF